ncbi:MAG: hypothetical protein HPY78_04835 [Brevinematales bacterium]|nr:hypothetical protein [Brevinematales bacterium]
MSSSKRCRIQNFTNWGIYYWLNHEGFREFAQTQNPDFINVPHTGIPIKTEAIIQQRERLLSQRF